jgi:hypothetical protein
MTSGRSVAPSIAAEIPERNLRRPRIECKCRPGGHPGGGHGAVAVEGVTPPRRPPFGSRGLGDGRILKDDDRALIRFSGAFVRLAR